MFTYFTYFTHFSVLAICAKYVRVTHFTYFGQKKNRPVRAAQGSDIICSSNDSIIQEIKQRLPIEEACRIYGNLTLKHDGSKRLQACCPFHSEKSASFKVWPETGNYQCFGCGEKGDSLDFVGKIKNYDVNETIKFLIADLNINVEPVKKIF